MGSKGFTLIEVLVYLALLSLILVGLLAFAFSIFQGSDRTQTKIMVQEEGDFLLGKINWALTGATGIAVAINPLKLTIARGGNPTTVVFDSKLQIKRNSEPFVVMNNSNVTVSGLAFTDNGNGTPVESVTISFTLNTFTPNGQPYSQSFTITKYLRK